MSRWIEKNILVRPCNSFLFSDRFARSIISNKDVLLYQSINKHKEGLSSNVLFFLALVWFVLATGLALQGDQDGKTSMQIMEAFGILKHQGNDRADISIDLTSRRLNITRKENL